MVVKIFKTEKEAKSVEKYLNARFGRKFRVMRKGRVLSVTVRRRN